MVIRPLRHAEQCIHFGQQHCQRAAFAQHFHHASRLPLHQAFRQFLPHALRHQSVRFAVFHHVAHQPHGFVRHRKAVPRRKTRHAQNPHRVFGKCGRHMAQNPALQILLPAERVDNPPVLVLRHRIDGQIAPLQIFFQRHIRVGEHLKRRVAAPRFALGACQCVFLVALRMQEHGEILAHRLIALRQQLFRRRAHHHPVAVFHRQVQQSIAHRAADQINLHHVFPLQEKWRLYRR